MRRSYGRRRSAAGHVVGDTVPVVVALALVAGVSSGRGAVVAAAVVAATALAVGRWRLVTVLALAAATLGAARSAAEWAGAVPRHTGEYAGWVTVIGDPVPVGAAVRVTFEIEGERFDARLGGSAARRGARLAAGDVVLVVGERRPPGPSDAARRRLQVRHVVGRFTLRVLADVRPGSVLTLSADRVRRLLRSAADRTMDPPDAALFTGLVVGDDGRQPMWLVDRFRAAGLSHLCAVSGQNVAFFLAGLSPLLRRLRPTARAAAATSAIVWFCVLTRLEPSVLRAGAMAVGAVWATWRGRTVSPVRLLALAVALLVAVDPLLVWSVGFWLSVGATVGVSVLAPAVVRATRGPDHRPGVLAVTLGAQAGVALPSLLVFGRLPVLAVVANLLAVPVAGFVMLWGVPAAVARQLLPGAVGSVAMLPCAVGTRWVSAVAAAAASAAPGPLANAVGWVVVVAVGVGVGWRMRRSRTRVPS